MNDQWIESSYQWANHCKQHMLIDEININVFDYLDLLGLYETSWMTYNFDDIDKTIYRYPR